MTEHDLLTLLLINTGCYDVVALAGWDGQWRKLNKLEESVSRLMAEDMIETDKETLRTSEYGKQIITQLIASM